jgi:hypothetical protein
MARTISKTKTFKVDRATRLRAGLLECHTMRARRTIRKRGAEVQFESSVQFQIVAFHARDMHLMIAFGVNQLALNSICRMVAV